MGIAIIHTRLCDGTEGCDGLVRKVCCVGDKLLKFEINSVKDGANRLDIQDLSHLVQTPSVLDHAVRWGTAARAIQTRRSEGEWCGIRRFVMELEGECPGQRLQQRFHPYSIDIRHRNR